MLQKRNRLLGQKPRIICQPLFLGIILLLMSKNKMVGVDISLMFIL